MPSTEPQEIFTDVQHLGETREDQNLLPLLYNQFVNNFFENDEFGGCMDNMIAKVIWIRLCTGQKIWMVATLKMLAEWYILRRAEYLSELHKKVHQLFPSSFLPRVICDLLFLDSLPHYGLAFFPISARRTTLTPI